MAELVLTGLDNATLHELQQRATSHGRTPEEEAEAILAAVLNGKSQEDWAPVDAIYSRLAASSRSFSDSADLLREDRDR